jgi:lauroyl/myristoyl acyltransferase
VVSGHRLTVVVDTFADARLNALVVGARERLGMKVVAVEKAGPSLIRALRRAEVVALLIDKPSPGRGVTVSFFGRPVEVPAGPAHLALRTGAALVPCAAPRLQRGRFAFQVLADLTIDTTPTGDQEADVRRLTQALMSAHERYIRCYPDQWYMFREMWPRTRQGTTP